LLLLLLLLLRMLLLLLLLSMLPSHLLGKSERVANAPSEQPKWKSDARAAQAEGAGDDSDEGTQGEEGQGV
jgi:hypothetical protein